MDYPLLGAMGIFFCLSFIMAWTIDKLPVWCQTSWFIISVWGIFFVGLAIIMLYPASYPYIFAQALIFLAALPGMMWLDYLQKRSRVSYWEKTGNVPTQRIIYVSDILDRLAFWWTRRRVELDDELETDFIFEPDNDNCNNHVSSCSIHSK